MVKYSASYYEKHSQGSITSLDEWDPAETIPYGIMNYQRMVSMMLNNPDPPELRYQLKYVRIGQKFSKRLRSLPCVKTMTIKWYVTFGLFDKFMYLLEVRSSKTARGLRMTGIFEPSAIISNQPSEYFYSQFRIPTGKGLAVF